MSNCTCIRNAENVISFRIADCPHHSQPKALHPAFETVQNANYAAAAAAKRYAQTKEMSDFETYRIAATAAADLNEYASQAGFIDEISIAMCLPSIR